MNNFNERIIAFGDIHGCYKAAETAIKLAEENNATAVFLGDYVDRGPDSIKTLEVLIEAKENNPDWIFLRGNHDQMLLDLILGKQKPNVQFKVLNGLSSNEETTKVFLKWQSSSVLLKNEIVSFLESTIFYHETEYWIFVHAPLKDNKIPLDKKLEEELIWNYSLKPTWEGKQFMHGHSTVSKRVTINKGTNINTLCGYGGVLSGMLILISNPLAPSNKVMEQRFVGFSISEDGVLLNSSKP
jgi:serine/threonine protein phosphatase 1